MAAALTALLFVTAGCTTPVTTGEDPSAPPGYGADPLGWERGYWVNDSLAVDGTDGYDRAEIERVVARAMARLERLRGLEFTERVSVEVISRATFRERNSFGGGGGPFRDQVDEALFLVGEDTASAEATEEIYASSVVGYYAGGEIVLVSDDPDDLRVDRGTLVHELVHALQDQNGALGGGGVTADRRRAALSVTEGEANYLMDRYDDRCGGAWSCIPVAAGGNETDDGNDTDADATEFDRGLFLVTFLPYAEGPRFVAALRERGGWSALDRAYDRRPNSTEQVIHPERYPEEPVVDVTVPDRSNGSWERFGDGSQTVGEAALYATMWDNGVVPEDHLYTAGRRYNYSHPVTTGWAGDALVPYRRSVEDDDYRYGYVFETAWDTEGDAREFERAYRELLYHHDARSVGDGVYRVPDSDPFGDAFRVVRSGKRVRVVNAPTVAALDGVHGGG